MTIIKYGQSATTNAVTQMIDDSAVNPFAVTFSDADVGGVRRVTATWVASQFVMDSVGITLAAGSIVLNTADVAAATTYYVFVDGTSGTPTVVSSTSSPVTNPAVDEYAIGAIIRFKSVGGVLTVYWSKQPNQDGIYELAHNLKEDSMFNVPTWLAGIALTVGAGGKLSTGTGYVRFPGNEPRIVAAVTDGTIAVDDETTVAGTDNIITYADGSAVTADKWHKLLLGITRDKAAYNTAKFIVMRQAKPAVEYATAAAATIDAENMASSGFPGAYLGAVTPLYFIVTQVAKSATAGFAAIDIRATGIVKGASGAAIASHHGLADLTGFDDHSQYIPVDGSRALTGNWTAAKNITTVGTLSGSQLISTIADGTKPFDVTSKTVTTNLNADMVDGVHEASFVLADGSRALSGNWAAAKDITTVGNMGSAAFTASGLAKADTFQSTHAIGVAPYTATSTTVCTNVNADAVDGIQGANIVTADGLTPLTAAWDVGSWQVRAETFQSDIATGTAPFTVASATVVTNLNASALQGNAASAFAVAAKGVTNGDTHDHVGGDGAQIAHSGLSGLTSPADDHTQYLLADGTRALSGNWNAGSKSITTTSSLSGSTLVSTLASGGLAPMTITSTTKVTNLNADMLDGLHDTAFLKADGSVNLTGNLSVDSSVTIDGVDISAHALNANAHHEAITLSTAADTILQLSTQQIDLDTQTASHALMGPASGSAAAKPTFRAIVQKDILQAEGTLTLVNGQNDNVALTDGIDCYKISGPTGNFGFSGFTGGYAGRRIVIANDGLNKAMTAYHQVTSTAANRIVCAGNLADTSTTGYGLMEFVYFGTTQRWYLVSILA
jgi:hypothetical protein